MKLLTHDPRLIGGYVCAHRFHVSPEECKAQAGRGVVSGTVPEPLQSPYRFPSEGTDPAARSHLVEPSVGPPPAAGPAARLPVTAASLSPQMTEGRRCQVHLLDDRKLELLVQVRASANSAVLPKRTWPQLRDREEREPFVNLCLSQSVR